MKQVRRKLSVSEWSSMVRFKTSTFPCRWEVPKSSVLLFTSYLCIYLLILVTDFTEPQDTNCVLHLTGSLLSSSYRVPPRLQGISK